MADTLARWLERLETFHPAEIELGLPRVAAVSARLGCDRPACPVLTVAGTNGKGSVVAVVECIARHAGLRVGCYTSPHILRFNERVRRDGAAVDDATLVAAFERVDAARGDTPLTYFEFTTLAALVVFADEPLDLLLLEVGLGGRLDAVNIVDPTVAAITRIDLDHQAWLGDNRECIGAEKAGILRSGIPVVIGDPAPPRSVLAAAARLGCEVHRVRPADSALFGGHSLLPENIATGWRAAGVLGDVLGGELEGVRERITEGKVVGDAKEDVAGGREHSGQVIAGSGEGGQAEGDVECVPEGEAAGARWRRLAGGMKMTPEQLRGLLRSLHLPGRLQPFCIDGRRVTLDVAHNPAGVRRLVAHLAATQTPAQASDQVAAQVHSQTSTKTLTQTSIQPPAQTFNQISGQAPGQPPIQAPAQTQAVFAALSDKDIHAMIRASRGGFAGWHVTNLPGVARGVAATELAAMLEQQGEQVKSISQKPQEALARALGAASGGVAVFGTFHLASALLETLRARATRNSDGAAP